MTGVRSRVGSEGCMLSSNQTGEILFLFPSSILPFSLPLLQLFFILFLKTVQTKVLVNTCKVRQLYFGTLVEMESIKDGEGKRRGRLC